MRTMLEFKEILKKLYSKYEVFILPVAKFLLALIALLAINAKLGYMEAVNNSGVVLIVALLCSFLPTAFVLLFGALFILLHFYALAIEVALVGLCVFLVMGLLFLRFVRGFRCCLASACGCLPGKRRRRVRKRRAAR